MTFMQSTLKAIVLSGVLSGAVMAQVRFTFNAAGDEVKDSKTGLTWKRCTEGQSWSGQTCANAARTYTQEEALIQFKATTATKNGAWRLPTVDELSSLAGGEKSKPTIDGVVFPQTQASLYWALPYAGTSNRPWGVDFGTGFIGDGYRSYNSYVRLVK
jgi:hypothetical protein